MRRCYCIRNYCATYTLGFYKCSTCKAGQMLICPVAGKMPPVFRLALLLFILWNIYDAVIKYLIFMHI